MLDDVDWRAGKSVVRGKHGRADRLPLPADVGEAMVAYLLKAGIDTTVIALWLGHEQVETTRIYLHADLAIKEQALARTAPVNGTPGRYRPPDALLAFLEAL